MSEAAPSPGNGRAVLLLIAGIPLTMILAASWLWYFVVEGDLDIVGTLGTANHGELIQPPRQIAELVFRDDAGAAFDWRDVEPRWTMLLVNRGGVCGANCERRLYTTRQIHVALGREFNRVRRVMVSDTAPGQVRVSPAPDRASAELPADLRGFAEASHAGLLLLRTDKAALETIAPAAEAAGHWYLVDPAGWVMMRVRDDQPYKDVIKDMKFLLKNSGG